MKLLDFDSRPGALWAALGFAAAVAQSVERVLGKDEVMSSSLISSFGSLSAVGYRLSVNPVRRIADSPAVRN